MKENPDKPRFSMLRTYTLADLFTLINAGCGTVAVFLCLNYATENEKRFLWIAFILIPAALICDSLDGYVAPSPREPCWPIPQRDVTSGRASQVDLDGPGRNPI